MALVEGTVAIILYIVVIILIFKLVRSVIKTVLLALLLVSATLGVGGFLIMSDFNDIRHNFGNSSKTIYLADGDNLLAGFSFVNLDSENMTFIELEELESMEESFIKKDYKYMINDAYKLFIFDLKIFNDTIEEGINFEVDKSNSLFIDGKKINESLYSDNPLEFLYDEMFDKFIEEQIKAKAVPEALLENPEMKAKLKDEFFNQMTSQTEKMSPGQERAMIFAMLFKSKISNPDDLKGLYYDFKDGSIKVYEETALFKLFKFMPKSIFENTLIKLVGNNDNET